MEQRLLRLGDIVDDYCTRERRLTNHVIVALVEDAIRQTRCTTCDSEHPYKGGKEPRLRKKPDTSPLYDRVLAGVQPPAAAAHNAPPGSPGHGSAPDDTPGADGEGAESNDDAQKPDEPGWPAHRTLIRATLPKTDNEPPVPRPIPEFTMYQRPPSRGRGFRYAGSFGHNPVRNRAGNPNGEPNGNVNGNSNGNGHGNGPAHGHGFGG